MEEEDGLQSDIRTPSTQISNYQETINEEEGTYVDELSTLYDDPAESIEIGSIRPISAPSQTSIYNEIEELSSLPRSYNESVFNEEVEDLNYDRYSQSITSYTGLYNNLKPRTVPPFYDNTTHREEYTWKYAIPNRFIDDEEYYYDEERYNRQGRLPNFEAETTNQATYQKMEIAPASRESWYSLRESHRELPKFDGQTTHREAFTPKFIQRLRLTPSTAKQTTKRARILPIENLTTNQRDYIRKTAQPSRLIPPPRDNLQVGRSRSMTPNQNTNKANIQLKCPAEKAIRSGIKNARHKNGHYYFQQATSKTPKSRHDSAPAKLNTSSRKSRRTKSTSNKR